MGNRDDFDVGLSPIVIFMLQTYFWKISTNSERTALS